MAVRSEEIKKQPARDTLAAPLSRDMIDKARPWIRLLLGAALIAWSSYTTVSGVGRDFAPLLQGAIYGIPMTLIGGLGVALFLSFGEWLTSEHFPILYCALLIIDARYTQQQIGGGISALAHYHLQGLHEFAPLVVSFLVSWFLALAVARYGEILLFGKRK
jgi:hypothetical protein